MGQGALRYAKQIAALTESLKKVTFPTKPKYSAEDSRRDHFEGKLRDLIRHNFQIYRGVDYSEEHGFFYWSVDELITWHHDNKVSLSINSRYHINPRKDLTEEFNRVHDEIERNRQLRNQIGKLMVSIGGGVL